MMPFFQRCLFLLTICLIASTFVGCGNGLARVSGNVTIEGEKIDGDESVRATIKFYPESGTGAAGTAVIDESGYYSLRTGSQTGLAPGDYLVSVSALKINPAKDPNYPPSAQPISPRKYANPVTSGLRAEVASGSNEFDFDLVPDPEPTRNKRRR